MAHPPNVLILCTQNAARSQMAEGLLRHHAGDRFAAYSAGLKPAEVHPLAIEAMAEKGIDISSHRSKSVSEYLGQLPVRYLLIVCGSAAKECPSIWPGVRERELWPFEDPAACEGDHEQKLAKFREVRDAIEEKLLHWIDAKSATGRSDPSNAST